MTTATRPLTPRQRQVLDFVLDHAAEHGRAPTTYEIARELGIGTNTAEWCIRRLRSKGHITPHPSGERAIEVSTAQRKGARGEREVARLWRRYGWQQARPSPRSGGLRPAGAGDLSPVPGDVAGIRPWICEVKLDERVQAPSRGWIGEAFLREALRDLAKLWARHRNIVGAQPPAPVLFARAQLIDWRVFIPDWLFLGGVASASGLWSDAFTTSWVEIWPELFFAEWARPEAGGAA